MSKVVPESVKKYVRSVLLSKEGGVKLKHFARDYKKLVCQDINWTSYGFKNIHDFFQAIPEVARVDRSDDDGELHVYGVSGDTMSYMNVTARKAEYKPKHESEHRGNILQQSPLRQNRDVSRNYPGQPRDSLSDIIASLFPDYRGLWCLCLRNIPVSPREILLEEFSEFGVVKELTILPSSSFVFLRFDNKKSCIKTLSSSLYKKYQFAVPHDRNQVHKVSGGNMNTATKYTPGNMNVNSVISASPHNLIDQKMQAEKMKPKIFGEVDATLSSSCKDHLKKADILEDTLDDVANKLNIDIRLVNKCYHMVGHLDDVICAEKVLVELMHPPPRKQLSTDGVSDKHAEYSLKHELQDNHSEESHSCVLNKHTDQSGKDELRGQSSRNSPSSVQNEYSEDELRDHNENYPTSVHNEHIEYYEEHKFRGHVSKNSPISDFNKHTGHSVEDELKDPDSRDSPYSIQTKLTEYSVSKENELRDHSSMNSPSGDSNKYTSHCMEDELRDHRSRNSPSSGKNIQAEYSVEEELQLQTSRNSPNSVHKKLTKYFGENESRNSFSSIQNVHAGYAGSKEDELQDHGSGNSPSSIHNEHTGISAEDDLRGHSSRNSPSSVEDELTEHAEYSVKDELLHQRPGYSPIRIHQPHSEYFGKDELLNSPSSVQNAHTGYSGSLEDELQDHSFRNSPSSVQDAHTEENELRGHSSRNSPSSVHNEPSGYSEKDELGGHSARTVSFHNKHTGYPIEDELPGQSSSVQNGHNGHSVVDSLRGQSCVKSPVREARSAKLDTQSEHKEGDLDRKESSTQPLIGASTQPPTEASTEPLAEVSTQPLTEVLPQPLTEASTQPLTEASTRPLTETSTQPLTEASLNRDFSEHYKKHHDVGAALFTHEEDENISSNKMSSFSKTEENLAKIEPETVIVDPFMWEFVEKFEDYSLRHISKNYGVHLKKQSLAPDLLQISVIGQSSTSRVKEAATKMSSLYHCIYERNVLESCRIPHHSDKIVIKQVKQEVQDMFYNVMIKENPDSKHINIIGKLDIAVDARKHLQHLLLWPKGHSRFEDSNPRRRRDDPLRSIVGRQAHYKFGEEARIVTSGRLNEEYTANMQGFGKYTKSAEQRGEYSSKLRNRKIKTQLDKYDIEANDEKLDEDPEMDISYFTSEANSHASETKTKPVPVVFTDKRVHTPPPPLEDISNDDSNPGDCPYASSTLHMPQSKVSHAANKKNDVALQHGNPFKNTHDERSVYHNEHDSFSINIASQISEPGLDVQGNVKDQSLNLFGYSSPSGVSDMSDTKQKYLQLGANKAEGVFYEDVNNSKTMAEKYLSQFDPFKQPDDAAGIYALKPSPETKDSSSSPELSPDPHSPLIDVSHDVPPTDYQTEVVANELGEDLSFPGNVHTERNQVSLVHQQQGYNAHSRAKPLNTSHLNLLLHTDHPIAKAEGDDDRHMNHDEYPSPLGSDHNIKDIISQESRVIPQPENGHIGFDMSDEIGKLKITFKIPEGQFNSKDMTYPESRIQTYLPHSRRGKDIMQLLQLAFSRRVLFVGIPDTQPGMYHYKIVPNNVSIQQESVFLPDEDYLAKLELELAELGLSKVELENEKTSLQAKYDIEDA